jgi:hypothetical protein
MFVDKHALITPGPGKYSVSLFNLSDTKKGFQFNKDQKLKSTKSFTPGPGQYETPYTVGQLAPYVRITHK